MTLYQWNGLISFVLLFLQESEPQLEADRMECTSVVDFDRPKRKWVLPEERKVIFFLDGQGEIF